MVHAVSRAAAGVANTLDNAIEQLMEGWVSPLDSGGRRRSSARAAHSATVLGAGSSEEPAVQQSGDGPPVSRAHSRDPVSTTRSTLPAVRRHESRAPSCEFAPGALRAQSRIRHTRAPQLGFST